MEKKVVDVTKVEKKTVYIAADGTEFYDEKQCEKYEQSAIGVVLSKMKDFKLAENFNSEWLEGGDGVCYSSFMPIIPEHIDLMNQLYILNNLRYNNINCRFTKDDIGKLFFLAYSSIDDIYWFEDLEEHIKEATGGKFRIVFNDEDAMKCIKEEKPKK